MYKGKDFDEDLTVKDVKITADLELGKIEKPKSIHTFEEAVALTGNGKLHFLLLLVCGFALLGVITEGLNMSVVLPAARCDLHFSTTEQGLINAVGFIGVVVSSHFWGFLADTWGRRKVLKTALLGGFFLSSISSMSISTEMLLITRLLVGLCISGVQASAISYLGEFHCNLHRSRAVTFAAMFMPISVVYQAIVGWFIMTMNWELSVFGWFLYKPWRLYILCSSIINAACFMVLVFLPESPKFMLAMGKNDKSLAILKRVYSLNTGNAEDTFPVQEISLESIGSNLSEVHGIKNILATVWKQTWPLFKVPYIMNLGMLCYLSCTLYIVSHGVYLWYPMILGLYNDNIHEPITTCQAIALGSRSTLINVTALNTSPVIIDQNDTMMDSSSTMATVLEEKCTFNNDPLTFQVIVIMGSIFAILYSFTALNINRLGKTYLLTTWIFMTAVTCFSLIWANNFYLNTFLMIILLSCGNCGSVLSAVSADLFPTHYKGMALCLIMMSARIGSVTGSNLVGALLHSHCSVIFYVCGFLLLSCGVVCYIVLKKADDNEKKTKTIT